MKLVYLTRNEEGIKLVHEKPKGVSFSKDCIFWSLRGFSFFVGKNESQFLYNGLEVIGVFDLDKPKHLNNMMEMFESHLRHLLEKKIMLVVDAFTPVKKDNEPSQSGSKGFHFTSIGSAIAKVFRHGDDQGDW